MKKYFLKLIFVLFLLNLVSCNNSNPFSGKKYVAELMGFEVIGLDFITKSKVEIYFTGTEKQSSDYTFDKKNNKLTILNSGIELNYNPKTYTLKWTSDGTEFIFHLTEEINISDDIGLNSFTLPTIPSIEEYESKKIVYSWSEEYRVMSKTTDNNYPYLSVIFAYKQDDKTTSTELAERKAEIENLLKDILSQKSKADLGPTKEEELKIEIRDSINDKILKKGKIRRVAIQDLYYK